MADRGTVNRDGFGLVWIREGSGPPLMVLGAHRFYRRYFPQSLRDHFEIVFCDLRQWVPAPDGFDVSTITRETFSADIDAVRRAAGFDRPIVAGQSQHGALALEYAQRFPQHVRGVAAIAPAPPSRSEEWFEARDEFFRRDADADRLTAHERNQTKMPTTVETVEDFIKAYVADSARCWYDPTFDCSELWEGVDVNMAVMSQVWAPAVLGGYSLEESAMPVFLALGRYDYLVPYEAWDDVIQRLANVHVKLYDRSAHQPPYEQPEEFSADLVEWAATLSGSGPMPGRLSDFPQSL
jgi:proline iminopeptidase